MANTSPLAEKTIFRIVMVVSVVVFLLVLLLDSKVLPKPDPMPAFVKYLPTLNACINATCTILLLLSFRAIKQKKVDMHKRLNLSTFFLSSLFLVSYVLYHWMSQETRFPEDNPLRPVYLTILLSHIVLAAVVLPLVLISFWYGLTNQVAKHRRIAKWTFPVWLYVTTTGVIVYLMISPYYRF